MTYKQIGDIHKLEYEERIYRLSKSVHKLRRTSSKTGKVDNQTGSWHQGFVRGVMKLLISLVWEAYIGLEYKLLDNFTVTDMRVTNLVGDIEMYVHCRLTFPIIEKPGTCFLY